MAESDGFPWWSDVATIYDANGVEVMRVFPDATGEARSAVARARFIVRACNTAHEAEAVVPDETET